MMTPLTFANAIGRKLIAETLQVHRNAVHNAVERGEFPASWYAVLRSMGADAEVECPLSMFAMREPNDAHAPVFPQDAGGESPTVEAAE